MGKKETLPGVYNNYLLKTFSTVEGGRSIIVGCAAGPEEEVPRFFKLCLRRLPSVMVLSIHAALTVRVQTICWQRAQGLFLVISGIHCTEKRIKRGFCVWIHTPCTHYVCKVPFKQLRVNNTDVNSCSVNRATEEYVLLRSARLLLGTKKF